MGFSLDELVDAEGRLALGSVAGDRRLVPGERHSRATAIERSGVTPDRFDALSSAAGLTPVSGAPPGEVGYVDAEIEALATLDALAATFSEEEALAFVRVVGSALARLGEAGVSVFLSDVEEPHVQAGLSEAELAHKVFDGVGLLDGFIERLDPLFRRHVLQAIERTRVAMIDDRDRTQYRFAVGFVDLVGFTALSSQMEAPELARFLRGFDARSHELVTAHGARVVKLIGDEVMFVATDPSAACSAARSLVEGFTTDGVVPRGGVAFGHVLLRAGDYFGDVVNIAARLVDEAVPGEVLVTVELADAAADSAFEPAGRRQVKGFDDPVEVKSLGTTSR